MGTKYLLALLTAAALTGVAPAPTQATDPVNSDPEIQAGGFDFTRPEVVATGLQIPWGMAFLPDGSALVAERNTARIMRLRPGMPPVVAATVPGVVPAGESGLLGIAVSPTYATDQLVYAYFTASADNRVVRFRLDSPGTQTVLRSGIPKANIHDGGRIAFGPDGMLYVATGDANNTSNAQNLNTMAGKILRMTATGGVPAGNPFANSVVWSYGHRNVQGLAWDTQNRMYATEFGQNAIDEINRITAGGNYGWPICEGRCSDTRFINPIVTWTTAEASPSGLAFANSTLFAAALRGQRLWLVPLDGNGNAGTPTIELRGSFGRLRTVMRGPDGWLWVATSNRDGRGNPVPADDRVVRFPPSTGGTVVFEDTFETNRGWVRNAGGTDTATTGLFERGDPEQTTSGGIILQVGTCASGANCLTTGRLAGGSVGANDIDGGGTTMRSPSIALPSGVGLTLSLRYYLAHLSNASSADYFRVRVNGTLVFERLGAATNVGAAWQTANVSISSFAGQTVTIQVEASDAATGSLVEAGVDDVRITSG